MNAQRSSRNKQSEKSGLLTSCLLYFPVYPDTSFLLGILLFLLNGNKLLSVEANCHPAMAFFLLFAPPSCTRIYGPKLYSEYLVIGTIPWAVSWETLSLMNKCHCVAFSFVCILLCQLSKLFSVRTGLIWLHTGTALQLLSCYAHTQNEKRMLLSWT